MRLADLLDRCLVLEERAAAVYWMFASAAEGEAELWEALAADEEAHAHSVWEARNSLASDNGAVVDVEGCEAALAEVDRRLRDGEALDGAASRDHRLTAAINIELSEIEALRQLGLRAAGCPHVPDQDHAHLRRLAEAARRRSGSDHVRLAAALLLARERLATTAGPPTSP
jgi:hypothetical protein